MLRKIAKSDEQKALQLWIEGHAYRSICDRLRISLGAINRIVDDARKRAPDIDELRKLNVTLKRGESSVYDAVRGAKLLDMLNERGVGLDRLHSYIELSDKISSERGVEAEKFVDSASKLMNLEGETGKTCVEIVKDFEGKVSEVKRLDGEKGELQKEVQGLKGELTKTEKNLSSKVQELKSVIETEESLKRLGLEKLAHLAKFVEGYEALGFSAQQVQKLVVWRQSLAEMGIDPDKLGEFIKKKGSLEKQISELEKEHRRVGGIVKKLGDEHRRLFKETTSLQAEVLKLSRLSMVVKLGKIVIPCRVCRRESVFVKLHTASEYRAMMSSGGVLQYRCFNCGQWAVYTPWDILTQVGLLAAPEQLKAQIPHAKD